MKWFLIGSLCLVCSVTSVKGDPAADLYNTGLSDFKAQKYEDAGKSFDAMIAGYPTSANIDTARIQAGLSYLYAEKFPEAVARLAKEAAPGAKPEYRSTALYFTALAQFEQGQKATDKSSANAAFSQAVQTLTTLISMVKAGPTPDDKGYLEPAIYYRSLSYFELAQYDNAEKDLVELTTSPQFSASLSRPDYFLRLGSVYEVETNAAVTAKKDAATIQALADKALGAFSSVANDPNALVQANDANMAKASVLFMIAQLDTTPAGYQKALDAYRQVRRKADMIPLQQAKLDDLHKQAQAQAQANVGNPLAGLSSDMSLLIQREQNRLDELKDPKGADPIVQALIGIAECYVSMKAPDEARTVLHRLSAHATLTPEQQQAVDFQTLYSYVLGGQTDQADKALTDYLSKHGSDPNADSISYQIAASLLGRQDYNGALGQADRSLKDFPQGRYAADAITLKAQALSKLGRQAEADNIVNDFLKANPTSPVANSMFLTKAAGETGRGDFAGAAADYQKVKDNTAASPDLQAAATAGYIQALQSQQKFDDVISEAKAFEAKFPNDTKVMPSVMLFGALALNQKHDPGAVAALQAVATKFPQDDVASPFALRSVVVIYQAANNVPGMIQAAADLSKAFPTAYPEIAEAADAVSGALIKEKKFDAAIALYQPLLTAPKPDVAAAAQNKIGDIWLAWAKSMGYYQSMPLAVRGDAEKRLSSAEQAYVQTLTQYPDQLAEVGDAFTGLTNATKQRRSWGMVKDADMEAALAKFGTAFSDHDMQTRFELAEAGLVFVSKDGAKNFPTALDRFKKAIYPNPNMKLTRQESEQFGELLLATQNYDDALKVYTDALTNAPPSDPVALASAYYGLGAVALGQNDLAKAKDYFTKMKALPGGGLWNPHIQDANYGIALADEGSSDPAATAEATAIYGQLMQAQGSAALQAKAMLGYGRLLDKAGHGTTPTASGPTETAVHYYTEPSLIFGPATPEQSAEGLYDAGQAYEKAGNKAEAKKAYDAAANTYKTTAPDWAAKAQAASGALGQ